MQTPPFARSNERLLNVVFLLPNVTESNEFMQITLNAFSEDTPDAAEFSRVAVPVGDEVAQVALQQLGPVDALEDVQRRARRLDTQSRRPANGFRRTGVRPRFLPVNTLPKVEDPVSASSTMVAYLLRPFSSPKDAERQLGPVGIIETSYRGASHSYAPSRVVVALEEPGDVQDNDPSFGGSSASNAPPLGAFGSNIAERLRHRGVDVPVFSIERRCVGRHRWLIEHIANMMCGRHRASSSTASVPAQLGAPATSMLTAGGLANLANSFMSEPGEEASASDNGQCQSEGGSESGRSTQQQYRQIRANAQSRGHVASSSSTSSWRSEPVSHSHERPLCGGGSAQVTLGSARSNGKEESEPWRWEAPSPPPSMPSRSFSAPRAISPSSTTMQGVGSTSTKASRTKDAPLSTSAKEDDELQRLLKAAACAPVTDKTSEAVELEVRTLADVEASSVAKVRAVEAVAASQSDDKKAEAVPADVEDVVDSPEALLDSEDGQDLPAPIVQVGDLRFSLPPPALAVQRITELWRPGACMVVITTQHYGTPLLCPDGDIMKGLVNIAPSAEGGQQLVPLFWQNVEEAQEESNGQSGEITSMSNGALPRMRGSQLPTMVEEEEDEEEDSLNDPS